MVKLTDKKIEWLVRHVVVLGDETPESVSGIYGVTGHRVRRLVRAYRSTGDVPRLNSNRRPKTYLIDG